MEIFPCRTWADSVIAGSHATMGIDQTNDRHTIGSRADGQFHFLHIIQKVKVLYSDVSIFTYYDLA